MNPPPPQILKSLDEVKLYLVLAVGVLPPTAETRTKRRKKAKDESFREPKHSKEIQHLLSMRQESTLPCSQQFSFVSCKRKRRRFKSEEMLIRVCLTKYKTKED